METAEFFPEIERPLTLGYFYMYLDDVQNSLNESSRHPLACCIPDDGTRSLKTQLSTKKFPQISKMYQEYPWFNCYLLKVYLCQRRWNWTFRSQIPENSRIYCSLNLKNVKLYCALLRCILLGHASWRHRKPRCRWQQNKATISTLTSFPNSSLHSLQDFSTCNLPQKPSLQSRISQLFKFD